MIVQWGTLTPLAEITAYVVGALCTVLCLGAAVRTGGEPPKAVAQCYADSFHTSPLARLGLTLVTGVLFVLTFADTGSIVVRVCWCLFWLVLVTTVVTDLVSMRVPNRLSLSAAVVFLALGVLGITNSCVSTIVGACVCSGLLLALNIVTGGRGMGMGDVKLYLCIGAMLGPLRGLESLIAASAFATIVAGLMLATGRMNRRDPFAFVPYIFAGVIFAVYFGPVVNDWYEQLVFA